MEKYLVFLDEEEDYIKKLASYATRVKSEETSIAVFTNINDYLNFQSQKRVNILAVSQKLLGEEKESIHADKIIMLSDECFIYEDQLNPVIFKFQSAKDILTQIKNLSENHPEIQEQNQNQNNEIGQSTEIISIISPFNDTDIYEYACSLFKSKKRKKSLYVSFDCFEENINDVSRNTMSDLLYVLSQCLKADNENRHIVIENYVKHGKDGICIIDGLASWQDLFEVGEREIEKLFQILREDGGYELVLINAGTPGCHILPLINMSDYVALVAAGRERVEKLEKKLNYIGAVIPKTKLIEYYGNM